MKNQTFPALVTIKGINYDKELNFVFDSDISLVSIKPPNLNGKSFFSHEYNIPISNGENIKISQSLSDLDIYGLSNLAFLFHGNKGKMGSIVVSPHVFENASRLPKLLLRLYKSGEFLTPYIVTELGVEPFDPIKDYPDLDFYQLLDNDLAKLKAFYDYLKPLWIKTYVLKKGTAVDLIKKRLNNAIYFFDKSYFDEMSFKRYSPGRFGDEFRDMNYLRLIYIWLGIESLIMCNESDILNKLKEWVSYFLPDLNSLKIKSFIDKSYGYRSNFVHANARTMNKIFNRDVEEARKVMKLLIILYFEILADEDMVSDISKVREPLSFLRKTKKLEVLTKKFKQDSGLDFSDYNFLT